MLFNIKSVFFLGLMATTYASPISLNNTDVDLENQSLEVRAAVEPMNCGGKVFTEDQIRASISQAKSMIGKPGRYPAHFANKKGKGNEKHISTGGPEGLEYPIKENGGLWTSGMYSLSACCLSFSSRVCILTFLDVKGSPGKYRVVGNKDFKKFMGMTMHIGSPNSGRIQACQTVSDIEKEEEERRKEQEEKSKKQSEEDKKKNEKKEEEKKKKKEQESDNCKRSKKHQKGGCK